MPEGHFLPRSVSKASLKRPGGVPNFTKPQYAVLINKENSNESTSTAKTVLQVGQPSNVKGILPEAELITAVNLALSDYVMWANSDLRYKLETGNSDGFIPLSWLIDADIPNQAALAQALGRRNSPTQVFEARMLISEPKTWDLEEPGDSKIPERDPGAFEIRRNDWKEVINRVRTMRKGDWSRRTVYIERLPHPIKTVSRISLFVSAVLALDGNTSKCELGGLVQNVCFQPLEGGAYPPGSSTIDSSTATKFHGFAFVTLRSEADAVELAKSWAWDPAPAVNEEPIAIPEVREALRVGFRALSMRKWLELKDEYLERQTMLGNPAASVHSTDEYLRHLPVAPTAVHSQIPHANDIDDILTPSYPPGCLVFVKNVHPGTNKTTLKALLASALASDDKAYQTSSTAAIDYVEYQKNIDSCHVRLTGQSHAARLQSYFASHMIYQATGLDDTGTEVPQDSSIRPISVVVVHGLKEEFYWGKIPEKVRMDALRKAGFLPNTPEEKNAKPEDVSRKRRRRG